MVKENRGHRRGEKGKKIKSLIVRKKIGQNCRLSINKRESFLNAGQKYFKREVIVLLQIHLLIDMFILVTSST